MRADSIYQNTDIHTPGNRSFKGVQETSANYVVIKNEGNQVDGAGGIFNGIQHCRIGFVAIEQGFDNHSLSSKEAGSGTRKASGHFPKVFAPGRQDGMARSCMEQEKSSRGIEVGTLMFSKPGNLPSYPVYSQQHIQQLPRNGTSQIRPTQATAARESRLYNTA
jgi:hypothetical protein